MRDQDFDAFAALLDDVRSLLPSGQPALSATAKAMFFRSLEAYGLADVRAALDAHVRDPQRGRFAPTPADVIAQLQGAAENDGRPGADEAWAIALQARDEAASVVWTEETAQAWDVARHVLEIGDEVGARMAFRDAYNRLVDEARRDRRRIDWRVSLGFDPAGRAAAIEQAQGLLAHQPTLALPGTDNATALFGAMPPHIRERLTALANRLRSDAYTPSADAMAKDNAAQRKAELAERVAEYERRGNGAGMPA